MIVVQFSADVFGFYLITGVPDIFSSSSSSSSSLLLLLRVASFSEANKMPLESLAKIFGPTLVGHASAKPDPSVQWKDAEKQPKV